MKNKETLSPSKISTYLACPTKYKWTYIDKRGRWYLRSKSYYSFGTSLHSVLQRFHDDGDKGVTTTSEAIAALEESWIQAGYASQDEMMQALSEGKRIVENYIDNYVSAPVTSKTMFVEKLLKFDVGEFVLIGRIDRLDEREDGSLDIVDYKSGRSSVSSEDIATDLAMGCYQLLIRHHYPGKKVYSTINALRTGAKASYSLSDSEAEELQRDIITIGNEILNRDYENLLATPKSICEHCDFLELCRKQPDFEFNVPE